MSSASSDGAVRLYVYDELRRLALVHPTYRVTASGVALRIGHDVASVRPVMQQAADEGLLQPRLVAKCEECGSEQSIDADEVEDLGELVCDSCDRVRDHSPYVVFTMTSALVEAAKRTEARTAVPKRVRRLRVPLLERLGRKLIKIGRGRAIS